MVMEAESTMKQLHQSEERRKMSPEQLCLRKMRMEVRRLNVVKCFSMPMELALYVIHPLDWNMVGMRLCACEI